MEVQIKKEKTKTRAGQVSNIRVPYFDAGILTVVFPLNLSTSSCRAPKFHISSGSEFDTFTWEILRVIDVMTTRISPFTLTSAPEEDYISVHIRVAGDFTTGKLISATWDIVPP